MLISKGIKNEKYQLTKETKEINSVTLRRIRYLRDLPDARIKKGDFGGWIEKEENLSQLGNSCIYGNAQVFGNAWVHGNVKACGDSLISGDARINSKDNLFTVSNAGRKKRDADRLNRIKRPCCNTGLFHIMKKETMKIPAHLAVSQFDDDLRNGDTDLSQWAEPLEDWQLTEIITAQAFEQEINDIFSAVARYIRGEGKDLPISQIISGMSKATRENISQAIDTKTENEAYQRGVRFYTEAIQEKQAA